MSLCFLEAFEAKNEGRISEKEYIGHLTAHLRGVRHDSDQITEQRWNDYLRYRDQFGALFRKFALSSRTLSIEETTLYDQLLQQCLAGDLEAMKSTFTEFESDRSLQIPLHALAVMVARKGRADILYFLLQKGATFDEEVAAAAAVDSIEMLEFLWNRNWRDIQYSKRKQEHIVLTVRHKPVGMLEFLLRRGAKFSPKVFDLPDSGKVSLPAMKLLVEGCGAGSLKGKAVFTLAVEEGNRDVVEYLCKLGVPINDVPPEYDIREPYANCSPLWAAVMKRDISMMELLLEHGADPNAPYARNYSQSLLNRVREQHSDDTELLAVLEKHAPTGLQATRSKVATGRNGELQAPSRRSASFSRAAVDEPEPEKRQVDDCPERAALPTQNFTPEELGRIFSDIDKLW
ncbi:hypothetical protein H2198_004220 [Neophaeococcomyces mojaviensis]|uniref:Uncharacterized protein n=1 Tax=Neophaeococcomyces mojaviensis TaxID=3383035 RepID=A0ACC3A9Y2_9EURO|nr:hypothetical protein H2198_004220 [Knufia sp. JES_112]